MMSYPSSKRLPLKLTWRSPPLITAFSCSNIQCSKLKPKACGLEWNGNIHGRDSDKLRSSQGRIHGHKSDNEVGRESAHPRDPETDLGSCWRSSLDKRDMSILLRLFWAYHQLSPQLKWNHSWTFPEERTRTKTLVRTKPNNL